MNDGMVMSPPAALIIRSAASFNIDGIIVKDRSFPSKSKLLYRSASGGTEHMVIFKESNLSASLYSAHFLSI